MVTDPSLVLPAAIELFRRLAAPSGDRLDALSEQGGRVRTGLQQGERALCERLDPLPERPFGIVEARRAADGVDRGAHGGEPVSRCAQCGDDARLWGDTFCYVAPDGQVPPNTQPYATIVTKDYPEDTLSALGWVAVVLPGERTLGTVLDLVRDAHDDTRRRADRRAARDL
ncbi:DUF6194 family protein [Leifsonia aquatica]|uniref:DUF6194 family protein n=1 Tax=Leifsonia aquatica TaxID=144185 RepID=UPI0028ADD7BC|nr:DUF6194 family protein [Leifsonia aquatica]